MKLEISVPKSVDIFKEIDTIGFSIYYYLN